jgi:hypothetical protein
MKAIGAILRVWFSRRGTILGFILPMLYFLILTGLTIRVDPKLSWWFFLYSFFVWAAMTGFHLRQIVVASTADLIPKYHSRQLMAAGFVLTAFLIWPVLFSSHFDVSLISTLAAYAVTGCLFLWIGFFLENVFIFVFGNIAVVFLISDSLKFSKYQSELSLIEQVGDFIGIHWPVYTIVVSALGFLIFVLYYRQVSSACSFSKFRFLKMKPDSSDWYDPLPARSAAKVISSFSENKTGRKMSLYRWSRLFQFGLFSPTYGVLSKGISVIVFFLVMTGMTAMSFHLLSRNLDTPMNVLLPSTYFWITFPIAMDFLSHRNRIPAIYLYAPVPSREFFMRVVFLSILLRFGQFIITLIVSTIIVHAVFPWTSWTHFPQLCAMGIVLGFIQIAATLLASEKIQSPWFGAVWLLGIISLAILLIPIAALYSHSWTLILACIPIGLILFRLAMRRWTRAELEFA